MLTVWQPPTAGNDGRGIEVDRAGRVFVAGGPAAEVRVFDRRGALLAELPTGAAGSYLNDVWIGPERSGDEPSGRGSLGRGFERGRVVKVMPTPAGRTFTTAEPVGRTLLAVDSKFGFPATAALAEDRIVAIDTF